MNYSKVIKKIISNKDNFMKELNSKWADFQSECTDLISSLDLLPSGREKEVEPSIKLLEELIIWTSKMDSNTLNNDLNKRVLDFQLIMVRSVFKVVLEKIHFCKYFSVREIESISKNIHLVLIEFLVPRLDLNILEDYVLLNTLFNSSSDYYNQNNYNNTSLEVFGEPSNIKIEFMEWINNLEIGEHIDCIKVYRTHRIWSRGEVLQNDKYQFKIKYLNSSLEAFLQNRIYEISPLGTMSKDFEWRNSLKIGDIVEFNDQSWTWICGKIIDVQINCNNSEEIKVVEIVHFNDSKLNSFNSEKDTSVKLEVNSPLIRDITKTYNTDKEINYDEDYFYLNTELNEKSAIVRPYGPNCCSSKNFVHLLNKFGEKGGFDLLMNKIKSSDKWCRIEYYIIEFLFNCGENLTQPLVIKIGEDVYKLLILNFFKELELNIRDISEYSINQLLKLSEIYLRRIKSKNEYLDLFKKICLDLLKICFSSEILKKQLLSIDILEYYCRLLNCSNDLSYKENFVVELKNLNIIFKILRGHESLFSKASYVLEFFANLNFFEVFDILNLIDEYSKSENDKRKKLLEFINYLFSICSKDFLLNVALNSFDSKNILNINNIDILLEMRNQVIKKINNKDLVENINLKILDLLQHDNDSNKSDHVKIIINLIEENDNYNIITKFLNLFISKNITRTNLVLLDDLLEENTNLNRMIFEKIKVNNFLSNIIQFNSENKIDQELLWELIFILCKHNRYLSFINYEDFMNIWKMSKSAKNESNLFFNHVIESKILESFAEQLKIDFKLYFDDFWNNSNLSETKALVFENIFQTINLHDKVIKINKTEGKVMQKYGSNKIKIRNFELIESSEAIIFYEEWWTQFESEILSLDIKINKLKTFIVYLFPTCKENVFNNLYSLELGKLKTRAYEYLNNLEVNYSITGLALSNLIFEFEEMFLYLNIPFIRNLELSDELLISFDCNFGFRNNLKIKISENRMIRDLYLLIGEELGQEISSFEVVFNNISLNRNTFNHVIKNYGFKNYSKINVIAKPYVEISTKKILTQDESSLNSESVELLTKAFSQYSFNDRMSMDHLAQYQSFITSKTFNKDSSDVIKTFKKICLVEKDFILVSEFIKFYTDAAKGNEYSYNDVFNNLKKLGYKDKSFEFIYDFEIEKTLRFQLSNDSKLLNKLFLNTSEIEFNFHFNPFSKLLYPSFDIINSFVLGNFQFDFKSINVNNVSTIIIIWYSLLTNNKLIINLARFYSINISESDISKLESYSLDYFISNLLNISNDLINNLLMDDMISVLKIIASLVDLSLKIKNKDSYTELKNFNIYYIEKEKLSKKTIKETEMVKSKVRFNNEVVSTVNSKPYLDDENEISVIDNLYEIIIKKNFQNQYLNLFSHNNNIYQIIFNIIFNNSVSNVLIDNHRSFYRLLIKTLAQMIKLNESAIKFIIEDNNFINNIIDKLIQENNLIKIMHKNLICFIINEDITQVIVSKIFKEISQRISFPAENQANEINSLLGFILDSIKYNQSKISNEDMVNLFNPTFNKIFEFNNGNIILNKNTIQVKSNILTLLKLIKFQKLILKSLSTDQKWEIIKYLFQSVFSYQNLNLIYANVLEDKSLREYILLLFQKILCSENELIHRFILELFPNFIKNIPFIPFKGYSNASNQISDHSKSETGYVGIKNPGCICYMNAILQQLFCIPTFRSVVLMTEDNKLKNYSEHKDIQYDDNMYHQLQRLFSFLSNSKKKAYSSIPFCYSYKDWDGNPTDVLVQHDADEFLKIIIDKVESVVKSKPLEACFNSVFGGKLCNILICQNCNYQKLNEEVFYDLSMEIKGHNNLNSSLMKLIEPEYISEYNCESCNKKCDITKRTLIKKLPNVLFIYLKKIVFDLEELINKKIHSKYEFPDNLNMKPFIFNADGNEHSLQENYEYILTGVVIHRGNADFGHYTSLINIDKEGKWLEFDDANVNYFDMSKFKQECFGSEETQNFYHQPSARELNMSKSAYILVYQKIIKNKIEFDLEKNNLNKDELIQNLNNKDELELSSNKLITGFENIKVEVPDEYKFEIEKDNSLFLVIDLFSDKNLINIISKILKKTCVETSTLINLEKNNEVNLSNSFISFTLFYQFILNIQIKNNEDETLIKNTCYLNSLIDLIASNANELEFSNKLLDKFNSFCIYQLFEKWREIMNILYLHPKDKVKELTLSIIIKTIDINFKGQRNGIKNYNTKLIIKIKEVISYTLQTIFNGFDKGLHPSKCCYPLSLVIHMINKYRFVREEVLEDYDISEFVNLYMTIDSQKVFNSEEALSEILYLINIFYSYVKEQFKKEDFQTDELSNLSQLNNLMTQVIHKFDYEEFTYSQIEKLKDLFTNMAFDNNILTEELIFMILKNFHNNNEVKIFIKLQITQFLIEIDDELKMRRISSLLGESTLIDSSNNLFDNKPIVSPNKISLTKYYKYISSQANISGIIQYLYNLRYQNKTIVLLIISFIFKSSLIDDQFLKYIFALKPEKSNQTSIVDWFKEYIEKFLEDNVYPIHCNFSEKIESMAGYLGELTNVLINFENRCKSLKELNEYKEIIPDPIFNFKNVLKEQPNNLTSIPEMSLFD